MDRSLAWTSPTREAAFNSSGRLRSRSSRENNSRNNIRGYQGREDAIIRRIIEHGAFAAMRQKCKLFPVIINYGVHRFAAISARQTFFTSANFPPH